MPIINADLETTKDEYHRVALGIRNPRIVTLPAGEALFRFASARRLDTGESIASSEWAKGAWWLFEADYRLIIQRHQSGGLGLGTVGRAAAAVLPSWSAMDVSIKARLLHDIKVYVGKGLPQFRDPLPNGMYMTIRGWPEIDQIYIPNLRFAASRALQIVRQKRITTDSFGF